MSETTTIAKAPEKTLPVEVFQEMDRRDENQILAEMRGEQLQEFVYSIGLEGRTVTNLSYAGVKEAIRRRGHVEILDYKVDENEEEYRALVRIRDHENQIDVLGASTAEKAKPFAYTLAVNKAERNAFTKLIPAKWIATLIHEWLERNRTGQAQTASGTIKQPKVPKENEASPSQKTDEKVAGTARTWKVPITKDQVSPDLIKKGVRQYPLLRGLQSYGMVNQLEDEISIVPEKPIPLDSRPVIWFIHGTESRKGVVAPICEKHGLKWDTELDGKGLLKAVVIYGGKLEKQQIDELVQGATWTFKAAMEPKEQVAG